MNNKLISWGVREELSIENKLRRSYYELLRDSLDQSMVQYSLIDSYNNFLKNGMPYPFVEKRELKPRARIPDIEYGYQHAFLVIFVEDLIASDNKKYIKVFDHNRTTKKNLLQSKTLPQLDKFDRTQKYLETAHFDDFLKILLPVDYALLIQREILPALKDRYALSHFHVKIDWPIVDAAEDLALNLRYIKKDIYEKGDEYAEDIQKKFFEYYGLSAMAGGRRTAAIVAAQYLKRLHCITTVYVGSSESRALIRLSERGILKVVLIKFSENELRKIAVENHLSLQNITENYIIAHEKKDGIAILQVTYSFTSHSRPPVDGKLREIKPDLNWLTVDKQYLCPNPGVTNYPFLPLNIIYS